METEWNVTSPSDLEMNVRRVCGTSGKDVRGGEGPWTLRVLPSTEVQQE